MLQVIHRIFGLQCQASERMQGVGFAFYFPHGTHLRMMKFIFVLLALGNSCHGLQILPIEGSVDLPAIGRLGLL